VLSDSELEALMTDRESDAVERKASLHDKELIRQAICAFANDLPGNRRPGIVLVGLNDDGSGSGFRATDEALRSLADMRSDGNILPLPTLSVQKRILCGCEVAVVQVEPSLTPPVRFKGRVWIRVGPRRAIATADEERRLSERRRAADLPFDQQPARGVTLEDLDLESFLREYLPYAIAPEMLAQNERTLEQRLQSLRFLNRDGVPNNAAILILGRDPLRILPGAYIQFLRLDGERITDPIRDQKEVSGPLSQQIRRLEEILEANTSVRTSVRGGVREERYPDYPIVALQQICRNALVHRTYEGTNAPVRVYWFADRIEVLSPGGLYGSVTPENVLEGRVTDYRNPLVAEAAKVQGFVQRFGLGIPLAVEELKKNGNPPPDFHFEPANVLVTLRGVSP